MLEDRDTSQRCHEAMWENTGNGSWGAEVVVAMEETWVTGDKAKERMHGCSYKMFLACKPPEFAGTTELVKCICWIKEIEMAFEASECNDNQRVNFASHLLTGEALTWWNLTCTSLTPGVLARLS